MLESEIKRQCRDQLEKWEWLCVHIIQCNKNGWPDTECFRRGRAVFIEFKRPGLQPDDLQLYRHKKLKEQGFEVIIARKLSDIEHLREF